MAEPIQIVIVGGGFGGMYCARRLQRRLRGGDAEVTVVNPENYMLYTPLLPEAASGLVEPRHVVVPLRRVLGSARLRVGTVTEIDLDARTCTYRRPSGDEQVLSWDRLVFAPGSVSRRLVPFRAWPSTPADAANLGRRLRVGLDWAVAVAMPRAIVELGSLGRTGPLAAKGAGR
jgi:NADPH-dependent 2,4-dienoyl-CoA reductase/sulfur reductase-like enzyme